MKRPAGLTRISPQVPGEFRPDPLEGSKRNWDASHQDWDCELTTEGEFTRSRMRFHILRTAALTGDAEVSSR
jgi:hypothetical protein